MAGRTRSSFWAPVFTLLFPLLASAPGVAGPFLPGEQVVLTRCEAWIDKAAAEVVAYHSVYGPVFNTRLYLKINSREIPLESIAAVRWNGIARTFRQGVSVAESAYGGRSLSPFGDARDYFVVDLGNLSVQDRGLHNPDPFRLEHEGAFSIETAEGVTFWINERGDAFDDFRFDAALEKFLKEEGQTIGSFGVAKLASVADAAKTADYSRWLNPAGCR